MEFPVFVLGVGRLAAAVRVQLRSTSGSPASLHRDTLDGAAALFVACSDFENATLRASLTRRAANDGVQILFASLTGRTLRVGPFMSSQTLREPASSYLTRSWDFSRMNCMESSALVAPIRTSVASREWTSPHVDTAVTQVAQIGASLVVRELANILRATRDVALDGGVAKIESPPDESQWSDFHLRESDGCGRIQPPCALPTLFGDTLSDLHDEAFVIGGIEWRLTTVRPARGWHPALLD
jgi:hypothetical protein